MTTALQLGSFTASVWENSVNQKGKTHNDVHTMMSFKEEDLTSVNGAEGELSAQVEADGEKPYQTPERRHVDALLDISEETLMKELEPYEYHCYSSWEEAVWGWARVAPLSCILLTEKRYRKPKQKEADSLIPSVDPIPSNADSPVSITEQHCKSRVGLHNCKKSMSLNQQTGSWSRTAAAAAQQPGAAEWLVLNAMQRNTEKIEEEGPPRVTPLQRCHLSSKCSENRPNKPQKHIHRTNNTVVPIKNFTFLPPIKTPQVNPKLSGHLCRGKKVPEGEPLEKNGFMMDKKTGMRGTRADTVTNSDLPTYSAAFISKYQHNPQFFSALSVSVPKRYQGPMCPNPDTAHHSSYAIGNNYITPYASQLPVLLGNKTACAVKLYETCEINV